MKSSILIALTLANLMLLTGVIQFHISHKKQIVEQGRTVMLPLLPRDPRSLIQGDYMILRQGISRQAKDLPNSDKVDTRGKLVLSIDDKDVGSILRFSGGETVDKDEQLIAYRRSRRGFQFGIESFFFEEGTAKIFEAAKFAEVRISESGEPVLVGLRDEDLNSLKPSDDDEKPQSEE